MSRLLNNLAWRWNVKTARPFRRDDRHPPASFPHSTLSWLSDMLIGEGSIGWEWGEDQMWDPFIFYTDRLVSVNADMKHRISKMWRIVLLPFVLPVQKRTFASFRIWYWSPYDRTWVQWKITRADCSALCIQRWLYSSALQIHLSWVGKNVVWC